MWDYRRCKFRVRTVESLRHKFARRIRTLMDTTPALDTQQKVSEKGGIAQSTIHRVLTVKQDVGMDLLEKFGRAFSAKRPEYLLLEPWEHRLIEEFAQLNEEDRGRVLGFISLAVRHQGKD